MLYRVFLLVIVLLNLNIYGAVAQAQLSCEFALSSSVGDSHVTNFRNEQQNLRSQLQQLDPTAKESLKSLINALYFFDYDHIGYDFIETAIDPKLNYQSINIRDRYGKSKSNSNIFVDFIQKIFGSNKEKEKEILIGPYDNFISALKLIKSQNLSVSLESIKLIHSEMMKGGVEGIRNIDIGVVRNFEVVGMAVTADSALTENEVGVINSNYYLKWLPDHTENGKHYGRIQYPILDSLKPILLNRIRAVNNNLADQIVAYQKNPQAYDQSKIKILNKELIEALTRERLQKYSQARAQLGEIKSGKNDKAIISLIASLQADLVSIHPFANGNGRTTRAFMNMLLLREGLPPALIPNPSIDIQLKRSDWVQTILDGVITSQNMLEDIAYRTEYNLPIENSPYFVFSGIPHEIKVDLKSYNKKEPIKAYRDAKVDKEQFVAFIKTKISLDPRLHVLIKNQTLKTMSDLVQKYVEFFQQKTIDYIHNKEGLQEVSLRFADPDFIDKFGVSLAINPKHWNAKIERHYKRSLNWRGLSNQAHEYTDKELVEHFTEFKGHLLSNRVAKYAGEQQEVIIREIKKDFDSYNKGLITGDYEQMVIDHSTTGPLYGESYGLSTSKKEIVGKAFAMGAMVVGRYGDHHDPELQQKLKSRINIASYRADKDIDLSRLHQLQASFYYQYPRQAEVMAIGGVEPDAVMLVQRIDADGRVIHTFARDLQDSNIVHKIAGRYLYEDGLMPKERILESFKLFSN